MTRATCIRTLTIAVVCAVCVAASHSTAGDASADIALKKMVPKPAENASAGALDVARVIQPWRDTAPDAARADRFSDPAEDAVRRQTLSLLPELRQKAATFVAPTSSDPQEFATVIRLQQPPADNEPPVVAPDFLPRPVLNFAPPTPAAPAAQPAEPPKNAPSAQPAPKAPTPAQPAPPPAKK